MVYYSETRRYALNCPWLCIGDTPIKTVGIRYTTTIEHPAIHVHAKRTPLGTLCNGLAAFELLPKYRGTARDACDASGWGK